MIRIGIAGLKARLSEHLKKVRNGETVIVMDRDRPVAQIVPYDHDGLPNDLIVDPPKVKYRTLGDIPKPPPIEFTGNILELLAEERADRDFGLDS
ncbi:MAG: type II toxin-antitoxin system prevent-host-death family antitoxin [Candidatus Eisenbacteria bacterium]|nr:type II toxin-antitoxin system prevent-host-death family antitoxin [Candidatus Eisenbacteria bacterium]